MNPSFVPKDDMTIKSTFLFLTFFLSLILLICIGRIMFTFILSITQDQARFDIFLINNSMRKGVISRQVFHFPKIRLDVYYNQYLVIK